MIKRLVEILSENVFVRNTKNVSENSFAEVYCPKFYPPKIFVLNVIAALMATSVVKLFQACLTYCYIFSTKSVRRYLVSFLPDTEIFSFHTEV